MKNNLNDKDASRKIKPRTIAFLGIYVSIFLLMTFVPQVGYIRIGAFNATMMAIPVALATIHYGWKGAIFGITCFIISSIIGTIFFTPPIITFVGGWGNLLVVFIIGRIMILIPLMFVIWIAKVIRDKASTTNHRTIMIAKYAYAFILGLTISIFNTIFVATLIYVYAHNSGQLNDSYWIFMISIGINISIEWTVPPFVAMLASSLGFYLEAKEKSATKERY
ncbi:hypothetical protein [Mycoplasma todarodis]|uniref:hypothetical protein n=1 Tax=Mycoplasma todarodis TaxID=1937191 RepID=UPI003B319B05